MMSYWYSCFLMTFFLLTLTNFSINLFPIWDGNDHEGDGANVTIHNHFTISHNLEIMAKSESDSIDSSNSILDSVHKPNLEKTVRDLSSFHTRHTASEYIDDVAYWLTEKLQNNCSRSVYVHNFTYDPEEADKAGSKNQAEDMPIYHLKTLGCATLG